jgi:hypothetical protein
MNLFYVRFRNRGDFRAPTDKLEITQAHADTSIAQPFLYVFAARVNTACRDNAATCWYFQFPKS